MSLRYIWNMYIRARLLRGYWKFRNRHMVDCGNLCAWEYPYGFVPECGCPIHDNNEFESYVWQENKEMPLDADNHSISGIGYLASWLFLEEVQMSRIVYNQYKIGPDY